MRRGYRPAVCVLLFVCGMAQGLPSDVDARVRQIEQTVDEIEQTLPRATVSDKDYGTPAGFGELLIFTLDGQVIKMVDTLDSDGLSRADEYYFAKGDLIYLRSRRAGRLMITGGLWGLNMSAKITGFLLGPYLAMMGAASLISRALGSWPAMIAVTIMPKPCPSETVFVGSLAPNEIR